MAESNPSVTDHRRHQASCARTVPTVFVPKHPTFASFSPLREFSSTISSIAALLTAAAAHIRLWRPPLLPTPINFCGHSASLTMNTVGNNSRFSSTASRVPDTEFNHHICGFTQSKRCLRWHRPSCLQVQESFTWCTPFLTTRTQRIYGIASAPSITIVSRCDGVSILNSSGEQGRFFLLSYVRDIGSPNICAFAVFMNL